MSKEAIKEKVLEIVAEKTGYPKDMLDLDLDLEADLGVDTVKQAEMFAAVRAAYNIPRDENIKLRDFPTLSHVINFAIKSQAALAAPAAAAKAEAPAAAAKAEAPAPTPAPAAVAAAPAVAVSKEAIKEKVLEIVAEKTGYPKDMLDLDLDLEADLGVDTVKQAEMFAAVRAAYSIPRDENSNCAISRPCRMSSTSPSAARQHWSSLQQRLRQKYLRRHQPRHPRRRNRRNPFLLHGRLRARVLHLHRSMRRIAFRGVYQYRFYARHLRFVSQRELPWVRVPA